MYTYLNYWRLQTVKVKATNLDESCKNSQSGFYQRNLYQYLISPNKPYYPYIHALKRRNTQLLPNLLK